MDRLTEKYGEFEYKLVRYNTIVRANARYKLGSLEDLMEKYKIKDVEMLEKMIIRHDEYSTNEESIGCPLKVIIKALQYGFKYKVVCHKLGTKQENVEQIIYCDYVYIYYADDVKAWFIATINECFYLKDYKKTWWLKEDKSE